MKRFLALLTISTFLFACGGDSGDSGDSGDPGDPPANGDMSFFVTSSGTGADGGDLGGLAGADQRCQDLAAAAGAGDRTWCAYLSTDGVDARDRIGSGPWFASNGDQVAADVEGLHSNGIGNELMLDENGATVPGPSMTCSPARAPTAGSPMPVDGPTAARVSAGPTGRVTAAAGSATPTTDPRRGATRATRPAATSRAWASSTAAAATMCFANSTGSCPQ